MPHYRPRRRQPMSTINVVPYIDVMLVLLIIFMVTAPMLVQSIDVDLPTAAAEPIKQTTDEPLIVSITAQGQFALNIGDDETALLSIDQLSEQVSKILRRRSDTDVFIWGDERVSYGEIINLMTVLQEAGAVSVGLVTQS